MTETNFAVAIPGLFFCVATLSACSSIIEGRSQEIMLNTSPADATCVLTRNNETLGTVTPTPGTIYIEKTKYRHSRHLPEIAGYEDAGPYYNVWPESKSAQKGAD